MEILRNYDLKKLNTFGIAAKAKFFTEIKSPEEVIKLFQLPEFKDNERLFLGGGSNVLFTKDFDGIVILNKLKGIEIVFEDEKSISVKAMGGELWHDLVVFAAERNYWGIENLSLVPGTVGAAPMQNIGAYGAELKNTLRQVEAIDLASGVIRVFSHEECHLGYRDSVFKNTLKGKYFILSITIELSKIPTPNISYKILRDHLEKNGIAVKSSKDIADAVADIRRSKLPDPKVIGNAGSFFKNAFLEKKDIEVLLARYPEMPHFEEDGTTKVPSAWFIEMCGWKGKRAGNAGVHDKQALVLINHGGATGEEIKNLAEQIIQSVHEKFGLTLTPEVNMI